MSNKKQFRRRLGDTGVTQSSRPEQMAEHRAVMRSIVESAAAGIIVLNDRGTVLEFNAAAEAIYGVARSTVTGTHISEYISPESFRKQGSDILHILQSEKETPKGGRWQSRLVGASGKVTDVELAVSRTKTREGLFVTVFIHDTGEIRKAARKLHYERERAERATDAKSRYLATMSHEIRTPLSAILGSLDLMAETTLTAEQRQLLETARLSGRAVKNVTDDIIDLSKIESGHLQLNDGPFDLMMLVEDTAHSIAPGAYTKGVEIVLLADAEVPRYFVGDMRRLQQILLNLLTNAVKFTREGAVILSLAAQPREDDTFAVRFSIADTGIGIPDSSQGRLFQEFFRGEGSVPEQYQGSGLGLAISKTLVSAMGGQVGVDSKEGEGSRFWFHVNLRQDPNPPRFTADERQILKRQSVVVQSNAVAAAALKRQLATLGDTATVMTSLRKALQFIVSQAAEGRQVSGVYVDAELAETHADDIVALQEDLPDLDVAMLVAPNVRNLEPLLQSMRPNVCMAKPIRLTDLWLYNVSRADFSRSKIGNDVNTTLKGLEQIPGNLASADARVLVVEDSEVNQVVVKAMLESENYVVDVVSDGLQAVDAATSSYYDLILMDLTMPEMDGVQASVEIRQQLNSDCPPIIAMTGNVLDKDRLRCQRAGMKGFMIKPIDKRQLVRTVALALNKVKRPTEITAPIDKLGDADKPSRGSKHESIELIETGVLRALHEQIGEANTRTAVRQFVLEAADLVTQLTTYQGDTDARRRAAHTLKSAAATFGMRRLRVIASDLEQAFDADDRGRITILTQQLEASSGKLLGAYRDLAAGSRIEAEC